MTRIEERLKGLMLRSLAGSAAAHRELLLDLSGYLRTYFRRRMHGAADAEDLVQETLLAIHSKRETFDRDEPLTAWVFAIARHKLCDWYRRRRQTMAVPLLDADAFTDGAYDETTARDDVTHLLDELPEKQAMAIRCMRLEGLSAVEAAARTGQSVSAVKVSVHRGLKRLADRLRFLRNENRRPH